MPDVEQELDELYALPTEEFTGARNELVKRLRAAGLRDESDAVKALRRPSAPAALVNRLARERAKELRALLDAGEALRKAHGQGGDSLRKAAETERRAVDSLVAEARRLAGDASEATLARVGATLRAAVGDPQSRPLLERGRLAAEVEPSGFEALAGLSIAGPPAARRSSAAKSATGGKGSTKRDRGKLDEARTRVKELRAAARTASRAASEAQAAAAQAKVEADRLQRDAAAAERDAVRAARTLRQAEERLRGLEDG